MLLELKSAQLFFTLHKSLMAFVNRRFAVLTSQPDLEGFGRVSPDERKKVSDAWLAHPEVLGEYLAANPDRFGPDWLALVAAWKEYRHGRFLFERQLARHAIFLTMDSPTRAYGVVALVDPLEKLCRQPPPVILETTLLPFGDLIVYDALLQAQAISFGASMRADFAATYMAIKKRGEIITSLAPPKAAEMAPAKTPAKTAEKAPAKAAAKAPTKAAAKAPAKKPAARSAATETSPIGRFRITSMTEWDQDFVDAEVEGFFEFSAGGGGSFQFGYVSGDIDHELTSRDGLPAVEFSWTGHDENDEASGRGWAVLSGDELRGQIAIHDGDRSGFVARRLAKAAWRSAQTAAGRRA